MMLRVTVLQRPQMEIRYFEHQNPDENNRRELLVPYFDQFSNGVNLLSTLLINYCGDFVLEKIDGWWYYIIKMTDGINKYSLIWHEDVGTYIRCDNCEIDVIKQKMDLIFKHIL